MKTSLITHVAFVFALLTLAASARGQSYNVSAFSGLPGVSGTGDTVGVFRSPSHIARDGSGNIFLADSNNATVRKITPGGLVSTLAGTAGQTGSTNGTGAAARFGQPVGIAVDGSGNVFVTDSTNHTIRMITSAGVVTTLAGTTGSSGSADGTGAVARFNRSMGLALDGSGNLYVADFSNHTIRKIVIATAVVTTLAGQAGSSGSVDGTGTAARFNFPFAVAIDAGGNLIVADQLGRTIRKVTPAGVVTTLAGLTGSSATVDGVGSAARFQSPIGLAVDIPSNTLFVADSSANVIRRMTPDGVVTTLCGQPGSSGFTNATGANARLGQPAGLAVDSASSTVFVSEQNGNTIRKVSFAGVVTPFVGVPNVSGSADTAGVFNFPTGTAVDAGGNVYVADGNNNVVRKVTPGGQVLVFAGLAGASGTADGTGSAARFIRPRGLALDASGNLFVTDDSAHTIRKITPAGVVTTFAGQGGVSGAIDGTGTAARFNGPGAIAIDAIGTCFVGDATNQTVRQISAAGVVTTLAGLAGTSASVDGIGAAARFVQPRGVALDGKGNLFVADSGRTIRKVVIATAAVTTVAGNSGISANVDGAGTAARFTNVIQITSDGAGNLFMADFGGQTIRKMTTANVVSTVAGQASVLGALDGTGSAARFNSPEGIAVDSAGNLLVVDQGNHAVRKITPGGVVTTFAGGLGKSGSTLVAGVHSNPTGIARDSSGNLYVADTGNHVIRKITPAGVVSTLAGLPGTSGSADGNGTGARFNLPKHVAISGSDIFVTDSGNHTIRSVRITDGSVSTVAGLAGSAGSADGTSTAARFNSPFGIAADSTTNILFVSDSNNHTIRTVGVGSGIVTTIAGQAGSTGSADGTGAAARFNLPQGLTRDTAGNLFLADQGNQTIRKITSTAVVTTVAGLAGSAGSADGTGNAARFSAPNAVTVDGSGNVFVADGVNRLIRKITPANVVSTIAGLAGASGSVDGIGSAARFGLPAGIVVDPAGVLFIADNTNHTIRKAVRASAKAQLITPALGSALVDPVTTFSWNAGVGVTQYALWVGSTAGAFDIYAGLEGTNLSRTVTNVPVDQKIFVTLWSLIGGVFQSNSYAFNPAPSGKALLVSPAQASTLTSATLALQWVGGPGCAQYAVWVGSAYNGFDLGAAFFDKNTTNATFTVPTDGGPVYVTVWSLINGAFQRDDHFFITQRGTGNQPARLTTPATIGSTLTGQTQNFVWDSGTGVTQFALWVGSAPDSFDIYAGIEGLSTSKTVTLPTDGRRIFVTVHSLIGGVFQSNSYFFFCSKSTGPAQITAPANGSTLAGNQISLSWASAPGATQYAVWVGSTPGAFDLHSSLDGLNLSRTVTGLPTDGRIIHVTVWSLIDGVFKNNQAFFNAQNTTPSTQASRLISPFGGTSFPGANVQFDWDSGSGVTNRVLWVGSVAGGFDLYNGIETTLTRTLTLPTDGRQIFVTLHSLIGGVFRNSNYVFTAAKIAPTRAGLTAPVEGSTFTSANATFTWTAGSGVTSYALWIGSQPGAFDLHASAQALGTTTQNVTGLPTDGRPIHVTLWSLINGAFQNETYVFNAQQAP